MKILKLLFYSSLLFLTIYNVYISSYSVRNGELNFFNDVARDFLLLQELDEKKIVLIGPRSSTNNLFHGPLWSYMNYPAYVLGNGDPVVVAWFWILLEIIFLFSSFFIVKKLFGALAAFFYILLTSILMASHMNGIFHSESTFFFIPFFFFTIYKYITSHKNIYFIFHIFISAIIIQLNIGVGIQFFILSAFLIFWFIVKNKLWRHLLTFSLLPLFLSNFIIFDLRHDFRMAKAIFSTGSSSYFFIPFRSWMENRISNIVSFQLLDQNEINLFVYIVFGFVLVFTFLQIKKDNKYRQIYLLMIFYYLGYFVLSFSNKGILLFHYIYLLIPLSALWLVSFLAGKYKIFFLPLILLTVYYNFNNVNRTINAQAYSIGKHSNSWKGLSVVASDIAVKQQGQEFGYYVFAPDAFAYQPRYAMIYNFKKTHAKAFEYVKKPVTYIIAAPPPADNPYINHVWWRKNSVKILSEPLEIKKFPSKFTIEKFNLDSKEQNIAHDKTIELGIHFR